MDEVVGRQDRDLAPGQTVTGQIIEGDQARVPESYAQVLDDSIYRDGYVIEGQADGSVFVDFTSDFDATLVLFAPDDSVIGEVPVRGVERGRRIPATFGVEGAHRLVVMSASPSQTGRYLVALHEVESAPPPLAQPVTVDAEPLSPDEPLAAGTWVEGRLEEDDLARMPQFMPRGGPDFYHDGFHFSAEAGARVRLQIEADFDPYLFLWSPERVVVSQSMNFRDGSCLEHTLETSGRHRVVVTTNWPSAAMNPDQGAYRLRLDILEEGAS